MAFKWLRNVFRKEETPTEAARAWRLRRWESAETDRLNSAHWANAVGAGINEDLDADLATLRIRSTYEASNNPIVEGVIATHAHYVVGPAGPGYQCESDSEQYNQAREELWSEWWAMPDINGQLSGVDLLRLKIRQLWTCGEYLNQIVTNPHSSTVANVGLLAIDPARLQSPLDLAGNSDVLMGVHRDRTGRPIRYYISQPTRFGSQATEVGKYDAIPARAILHNFAMFEPGQARGVPWLSSALQSIADLRDYDAQVLDAARQAADQAVFLFTNHPESNYIEVNEETKIKRRTITSMPPGWEPRQLQPGQPSAQYPDYRAERMREIGRAANMPLMMIRLDSQKHNYSSARFDAQVFIRGIAAIQAWLSARDLDRCMEEVAGRGELARRLPRRPERVRNVWTWPKFPAVDPGKEAKAEEQYLANGTLPYQEACGSHGRDWQTVIRQRKRAQDELKKEGLPPLPVPGTTTNLLDDDVGDDDDDESPGKKKRES